jgi:hypothetical protein
MRNFYHYILAMLYMKIAHSYRRLDAASNAKWHYWMGASMKHANAILKSLDGVE